MLIFPPFPKWISHFSVSFLNDLWGLLGERNCLYWINITLTASLHWDTIIIMIQQWCVYRQLCKAAGWLTCRLPTLALSKSCWCLHSQMCTTLTSVEIYPTTSVSQDSCQFCHLARRTYLLLRTVVTAQQLLKSWFTQTADELVGWCFAIHDIAKQKSARPSSKPLLWTLYSTWSQTSIYTISPSYNKKLACCFQYVCHSKSAGGQERDDIRVRLAFTCWLVKNE